MSGKFLVRVGACVAIMAETAFGENTPEEVEKSISYEEGKEPKNV
jgi:hypothetical protein